MILGHALIESETGHQAGRRLLAELYAREIGGELPEIDVSPRGKPCFVDSPWHFSISHTRRHVFCVLSKAPVGLDAEELDRKADLRLAAKILSPAEKVRFDAAEDKHLALLTFWVLKEAAVKLTGEGLRGYPNHTDFDLNDPRVSTVDGCIIAVIQ